MNSSFKPIYDINGLLDFNAMVKTTKYVKIKPVKHPSDNKELIVDLKHIAQVTNFTENEKYDRVKGTYITSKQSHNNKIIVDNFLQSLHIKDGDILVPWYMLYAEFCQFYGNSKTRLLPSTFIKNCNLTKYQYRNQYIKKMLITERCMFYRLNLNFNGTLEETIKCMHLYKYLNRISKRVPHKYGKKKV
jgi:hypothetical protein